jgi:hypothetical protein
MIKDISSCAFHTISHKIAFAIRGLKAAMIRPSTEDMLMRNKSKRCQQE